MERNEPAETRDEILQRIERQLADETYTLRRDIKQVGDALFWRGAACLTFFALWMCVVMLLT